ncbi:MAG: hypothetical protein H6621_12310 [Halobacteriovoraceae bacterium]|nr:hypothetical protein [Halobacteriovoraceae bacterium]
MNRNKKRFYRLKKPVKSFVCALCGAPREISIDNRLSGKNYIQIFLISSIVTMLLYPFLEWRGIVVTPIVWAIFDFVVKLLYRKQLPCPHCGFDAAWYCKDVRVAKQKVQEFWENSEHQHLDNSEAQELEAP